MNGNVATQGTSEDDTFRILARPSFDKIREMHCDYKRSWRAAHGSNYPSTLNVSFMKHHGWTWLEFIKEQHYRGLPARS